MHQTGVSRASCKQLGGCPAWLPAGGCRQPLTSSMPSRATLGASDHLDFELPFTSKLLLLAAYICSRNRPTLDRRLFDPSSRAGRRRSTMASDKQVRPGVPDHAGDEPWAAVPAVVPLVIAPRMRP